MNHELVKNIHRLGLENPPVNLGNDFATVKGEYEYYHYCCDQFDESGKVTLPIPEAEAQSAFSKS